jgi:hypothetical protein
MALEGVLDTPLVERATRHLSLTEAGQLYFGRRYAPAPELDASATASLISSVRCDDDAKIVGHATDIEVRMRETPRGRGFPTPAKSPYAMEMGRSPVLPGREDA